MGQTAGGPGQKATLLAIADFARKEHEICWPSQAQLAEKSENKGDTIRRHMFILACSPHFRATLEELLTLLPVGTSIDSQGEAPRSSASSAMSDAEPEAA